MVMVGRAVQIDTARAILESIVKEWERRFPPRPSAFSAVKSIDGSKTRSTAESAESAER